MRTPLTYRTSRDTALPSNAHRGEIEEGPVRALSVDDDAVFRGGVFVDEDDEVRLCVNSQHGVIPDARAAETGPLWQWTTSSKRSAVPRLASAPASPRGEAMMTLP